MKDQLIQLADKWEKTARHKFMSADNQYDDVKKRPTAKIFIEHGAMCYFNCAQELRKVLSSLSPLLLATQEGDQK